VGDAVGPELVDRVSNVVERRDVQLSELDRSSEIRGQREVTHEVGRERFHVSLEERAEYPDSVDAEGSGDEDSRPAHDRPASLEKDSILEFPEPITG
jgi:hypothetical protein